MIGHASNTVLTAKEQYEIRVDRFLMRDFPRAYQLAQSFTQRSDAFTALREGVILRHFGDQQSAHPAFCARAIAVLTDRVVSNIQQDLGKAA